MNPNFRYRWDVNPSEAIAIQKELAGEVVAKDDFFGPRHVAGIDVGFRDGNRTAVGAAVLLSYPQLELLDYAVASEPARMPYISGLLSFREIPAIVAALDKLEIIPDIILCDGQGIAHPRRLGLASHLGLVIDMPTIGVAKSRLVGEQREPGLEKGSWTPLMDKGEQIGIVLRSRANTRPLYISIGHRVSLDSAREIVMQCCPRYRLPETTRWAHRIAGGLRPEIVDG